MLYLIIEKKSGFWATEALAGEEFKTDGPHLTRYLQTAATWRTKAAAIEVMEKIRARFKEGEFDIDTLTVNPDEKG